MENSILSESRSQEIRGLINSYHFLSAIDLVVDGDGGCLFRFLVNNGVNEEEYHSFMRETACLHSPTKTVASSNGDLSETSPPKKTSTDSSLNCGTN